MKKALFLLAFIGAFVSCGNNADPAEVAGATAKQYYEYLLKGDYEAFVDGCYQKNSIRAAYRAGLIENAKMFVGQMKTDHNGVKNVEVKSAEADTASHTANVFLTLTYGDNTSEQVVVPMVQDHDIWYMR